MSWTAVIIVSIAVIILLAFVIRRNLKDEKKFERQLNETDSISKEKEYERDTENEID